jgi:hypothetical protein
VTIARDAGGVTLTVDPPRPVSAIVSLAIFTAIWTGAIALMIVFGAPVILILICIGIEVLIVAGLVDLFRGRTTLRIDDALRSQIVSVETKIAMSSGSTGSRKSLWYAVEARTAAGKRLLVARHLRDKRQAEAIEAKARELLGIS